MEETKIEEQPQLKVFKQFVEPEHLIINKAATDTVKDPNIKW